MPTYEAYLRAIQERVCAVCIDGVFDKDGRLVRCGLPRGRTCHVELYLPQVIDVVRSIDSTRMDAYVDRLRQTVCRVCEQNVDGDCALRLKAHCALDTYVTLVVGAIEEVLKHAGTTGGATN